MAIQIKLKNSVVQDSTPSTSDLPVVGELALNANINSIGGFMRASDNTIVKIFGPGSVTTPTATTTVSGISELATNSETTTGTATNRVVTPAGLNAVTVAERTTSNTNYVAKAGSTLTGVLTMPNGSNSAPAINFGDSDSGIFGGTNTVSLSAGGTTRLTADTGVSVTGTLAVTGAITSTSDLTIADKIIHSGDTNTAVRFPAADTVSVETGGSEALRVDSSGRLLVGTSSSRQIGGVTGKLQIEGTTANSSSLSVVRNAADNGTPFLVLGKSRGATVGSNTIVQDNDGLGEIRFIGADGTDLNTRGATIEAFVDGTPGANDMPGRLVFSTTADGSNSPTTRLTIDSTGLSTFSGNLKISSTAPAIFLTDTDNNPDYYIQNSNGLFKIVDNTSVSEIIVATASNIISRKNHDFDAGIDVTGAISGSGDLTIDTSTLKVDSTNNRVGIGTSNPGQLLDVVAASGDANFRVRTLGTNSSDDTVIRSLIGGTAGSNYIQFGDSDDSNVGQVRYNHASNSLSVDVNASEALRIDSSGRVMIDTSVEGNESADDLTISSSGNTGITIRSGTGNNNSIFFSDATSGTAEYAGFVQYAHASDSLSLGTVSTTRMKIDSAGRVGIGCTPTAQFNHSILQIGNQATLGANGALSTTGQTYLTHNLYFDPSGNYQVFNTSNANEGAIFRMFDGNFQFSNSAQTTGTPTVTERLRITSDGDVSIGGTTPSSQSAKLQTRGSSQNATRINMHHVGNSSASISANGGLAFGSDTANGTTERMRLDSSGSLLIGSTSSIGANYKLQAYHATDCRMIIVNTTAASSQDATLFFAPANTVTGASITCTSEEDFSTTANRTARLTFSTRKDGTTAERMRIDSDGDLLVGLTTALSTQAGSIQAAGPIIAKSYINSHTSSAIVIDHHSNVSRIRTYGATSGTGQLAFQVGGGGNSADSEAMRINASGKVGIGTTSPETLLHAKVNTFSDDINKVALTLSNNQSSGVHQYFQNASTGSGVSNGARIGLGNTDNFLIQQFEAKDIQISTNGTERMRINSSGNVGIGTASPSQLLQVAGTLECNNIKFLTANKFETSANVLEGKGVNGARLRSALSAADTPSFSNSDDTDSGMFLPGSDVVGFTTGGSERMRIDSSGQVGIGTSSPAALKLHLYDATNTSSSREQFRISGGDRTSDSFETGIRFHTVSPSANGNRHYRLTANGNIGLTIQGHETSTGNAAADRAILLNPSGGAVRFGTSSNISGERFTFFRQESDGAILAAFHQAASADVVGIYMRHGRGLSGFSGKMISFRRNDGTEVGSVTIGASSTAFNTSSDYRLKENVTPISDGITRLKTLKPYRFNFKDDTTKPVVDGFFAHEVTAVPEAITGTKDEVDADNNPVYQSIDQSKLVPLLVAAVQELIGRVEKLEAA